MNKRQWQHLITWKAGKRRDKQALFGILVLSLSVALFSIYYNRLDSLDVVTEFKFAQMTAISGWHPYSTSPINSSLLVCFVLSKVSSILNNQEMAYKILSFLFIVGILPLFYLTWKTIIGVKASFVASLLVAGPVFAALPGKGLRLTAGCFLVALFLYILNVNNIKPFYKTVLLLLCLLLLVLSYYAIAIILAATLLGIVVMRGLVEKVSYKLSYRTLILLTLFLIITTGLWLQISCYAFYAPGEMPDLVAEANKIIYKHQELSPYSPMALRYTGLDFLNTLGVGTIVRLLQYSIQIMILAGIIYWWTRKKTLQLSGEMALGAIMSVVLLLGLALVPRASFSYEIERLYQYSLFFIAPFCIMGAKRLNRHHAYLLAVPVIVLYGAMHYLAFLV